METLHLHPLIKKQKEKINTWVKLNPCVALLSSNINKLRGVHCINVETISSPKPKTRHYLVAILIDTWKTDMEW